MDTKENKAECNDCIQRNECKELHFTEEELRAIYVAFGMTVDCETDAGQLAVFGSPSKVRVAKATYDKITRFLNAKFSERR